MNKFTFVFIFALFISACGGGSSKAEPTDNSNPKGNTVSEKPVSEKPADESPKDESPKDGPEKTPLSEAALKAISEGLYYSVIKGVELNKTQSLISRSVDAPFIQLIHKQSSLAALMGVDSDDLASDIITHSKQTIKSCADSGSASITPLQPNTFTRTITFDQCVEGKYTVNGKVALTSEASFETVNIEPKALSVNVAGSSISLNEITYLCRYIWGVGNNKKPSCDQYDVNFRAANNRQYQLKSYLLAQDDGGHVVQGTLNLEEIGDIVIAQGQGRGIFFNCSDKSPSDGRFSFTHQGESVTIDLSGCHRYTVTYQGVSNTYDVEITP